MFMMLFNQHIRPTRLGV